MKKEILLVKSNTTPYWIFYAIFLGIALTFSSLTTETFTALPDFQGGGKVIVADLLIIPSTIGAIFIGIAMYRLPKCIEISEEDSRLAIDNINVDFPAEVTLESKKEDNELFKVLILSKGKQKLKTGFVYKIKNDLIASDPLSNRQTKLSFIAN